MAVYGLYHVTSLHAQKHLKTIFNKNWICLDSKIILERPHIQTVLNHFAGAKARPWASSVEAVANLGKLRISKLQVGPL